MRLNFPGGTFPEASCKKRLTPASVSVLRRDHHGIAKIPPEDLPERAVITVHNCKLPAARHRSKGVHTRRATSPGCTSAACEAARNQQSKAERKDTHSETSWTNYQRAISVPQSSKRAPRSNLLTPCRTTKPWPFHHRCRAYSSRSQTACCS